MINRLIVVLATLLLAGSGAACSRADENAPPVATPTVTVNKAAAAIGSPIEMRYRFVVAPNAPAFGEDYLVFVHFIDSNGELMWTDDHPPSTPTRQWQPGATVEYSRTTFIPKFPYVGPVRVDVGLYSPSSGDRLPLAGQTEGLRSYRVATFDMRLESSPLVVVFSDGWYDTETAPGEVGRDWQWSEKEARLTFRNPKRDARFYLQADQPAAAAFTEPQQVEIRIGSMTLDRFALPPGGSQLREIGLSADQLGQAETVEMTISVDKTFVPAAVPALKSADSRNLGIRVFRAFVDPM